MCKLAMCQADTQCLGSGDACAQAADDLDLDTVFAKEGRFFTATAEEAWIPPFIRATARPASACASIRVLMSSCRAERGLPPRLPQNSSSVPDRA